MTFQKRQNYGDNKKINGFQGLGERDEQVEHITDLADYDMSVWATLCMCGSRGMWEISIPSTQFSYEPKTALKKK